MLRRQTISSSACLFVLFTAIFFGGFLCTGTALAAVPSVSTAVMQSSTVSSVVLYLTGTNFNSFAHGYAGSQILTADSTDLAKITYNGLHPGTSTIVEDGTIKHLIATFSVPSSTTGLSGGSLTIATGTIRNSTTQNNFITIVSSSITDNAVPVLAEVTPVPTPATDNTPDYTFSSTEAGSITYGGDCSAAAASTVFGNNTITFDALPEGVHSNCTITVTDSATNVSTALHVSSFTIEGASYLAEFWNLDAPIGAPDVPVRGADLTRSDASINFSWGGGSPDPLINSDGFVARWTKTVYLASGTYLFSATNVDDGVRVYLDNVLIMDGWGDHGGYSISDSVDLLTGGAHDIRVEMYENGGGASITFSYSRISAPDLAVVTPVPSSLSSIAPIHFTFSSTQAGSAVYGGSCSSGDTSIGVGSNTITFNAMASGTYSDCTVTVTTTGTELQSEPLAVPSFAITAAPLVAYVDDDYASDGANDGHTWGLDAFSSLADAVDAVDASGTVYVASGMYMSGSDIPITKALSIIGPGIASGTPATVINNNCDYVFSIVASHVTISGLFIKETQEDGETYCQSKPVIRVLAEGGLTTSTVITGNDISGGKRGINLRWDSQAATISNNFFHDSEDGIALASSKYNTVSGNTVYNNSEYGVYFWNGDSDGTTNGNTVSSNTVHDNGQAGIYMETGFDNVIENNTVYANYKHGIAIKSSGVSHGHGNIVRSNTVYDNGLLASTNGNGPSGIEVTANYTQVLSNVVTHNRRNGIQIGGDSSADYVTVTGNTIGIAIISETDYEGNTERGIFVMNGQGHEIHNNIIVGNGYGVLNNSGNSVDATSNWWGSASGPLETDTNASGTGDQVSADVLYDPYLVSASTTSQLYVDDDYASDGENDGHTWGVDAFSSIPAALTQAPSGATIHVASGTYSSTETIVVRTPVTISGSGYGAEAPAIVTNTNCFYAFSIESSNVTVSGLRIREVNGDDEYCTGRPVVRVAKTDSSDGNPSVGITGVTITANEIIGGSRGINLRGDSSHVTLSNNLVHNSGDGISIQESKYDTISGNTVYNNENNGILLANWADCNFFFCDNRISDDTVSNNTVYGNGKNGIALKSDTITEDHKNIIDGNTVYNNGLESSTGGDGPSGIEVQANYTEVTNNVVAHNKKSGIMLGGNEYSANHVTVTGNTVGQATIDDVLYDGNVVNGIIVKNGTGHEIHSNNIVGNAFGVMNVSGDIVNATSNWWGSVSGPLELDTNPSGTGDQVSVDVVYDPYLSGPVNFEVPVVEFTDPTPAASSTQEGRTIEVKLTTSDSVDGHYVFTNFDNSLVGWWRFEGDVNDESGNENDGVTSGTFATTTGKFGDSFSFDGSSYITVARPVQNDFTVCAWIKTAVSGNGNNHWQSAPIFESELAGLGNDFGFGVDGDGHLEFGTGGPSTDVTINGTTVVNDNAWHFGCAQRTRSTGALRVYVDNALDAEGTGSTVSLTANSQVEIGAGSDGAAAFSGQIDDLIVFNRVLSVDEIASLYSGRSNQYDHEFSQLTNGTHSFTGYVVDTLGNKVDTGGRIVTVSIVGGDLYVDSEYGSGGENDGHTWGVDAFNNIPDAIAAANDGDTVHVSGGEYVSSEEIIVNKSISLIGPGLEATSSATIANNSCSYVISARANDVTISGFHIEETNSESQYCNNRPAIRVVSGEGSEPGPVSSISGVTITGNEIEGGNRGIILRGDSATSTISDNIIHSAEDGIYLASSKHNTISGNSIYRNKSSGIRVGSGDCGGGYCDGHADDNTIASNTIYANGFYNGDGSSGGIVFDNIHGEDNHIASNTVYGNWKNGIALHIRGVSEGHGNVITGNIVYDNGLHVDTGGPGPAGIDIGADYTQVLNNIVSHNNKAGIKIGGDDFSSSHDTITGNTIGSSTVDETAHSGNLGWGIYVLGSSSSTVSNNIIQGNVKGGVYQSGDSDLNATDNYWGSASGPTTITNPGGDGDALNGGAGSLESPYVSDISKVSAQFNVNLRESLHGVTYRPFYTDSERSILNEDENSPVAYTERGFRYGTSTEYGSSTSETSESFELGSFALSPVSPLACGTRYHFQPFAVSSGTTVYGEDGTFWTSDCDIQIVSPADGGETKMATPLMVITDTNATCSYILDENSPTEMAVTGGTVHTDNLRGLSTGEHTVQVSCQVPEEEPRVAASTWNKLSSAGVILYGADGSGQNSDPTHLYVLDPETGSRLTDIGEIGSYHISGLAVSPISGILYGSSGGRDPQSASLFTISTTTGAATLLGKVIDPFAGESRNDRFQILADIAFASDGTLYGWSETFDSLYTIDLGSCDDQTCAASQVAPSSFGTSGSGLALDSSNRLFQFGDNDASFREMDRMTGLPLLRSYTRNSFGSQINAASFDSADMFFAVRRDKDLITMNLDRGIIASMGGDNPDLQYVDALTFSPGTNLHDAYVDDDYTAEGLDDGHTWGVNAFNNIPDAIDAVFSGATVHVSSGTYEGALTISKSVTLTGPTDFEGAGPADTAPVLTYEGSSCGNRFIDVVASHVTIQGFRINFTRGGEHDTCRPTIRVQGAFTTITHNDILYGRKGIDLTPDSSTSTVSYNTVHNASESGIFIGGSQNNIISHNEVYDNGAAIQLSPGGCDGGCVTTADHNTISHNTVHNNGAYGIYVSTGQGNVFEENMVYANGFSSGGTSGGIFFSGSSMEDNTIASNTVYGNYKHGIGLHVGGVSEGHGNIIRGNLVYDNGLTASTEGVGPSGVEVLADYTQILNNVIAHNRRNGIQLGGDGSSNYATITGNTIGVATVGGVSYEGNIERGIYVRGGSGHLINNNIVTGNTIGFVNQSGNQTDATHNYWGASGGPTHATNPDGTGDSLSDASDPILINYRPFYTDLGETTLSAIAIGHDNLSALFANGGSFSVPEGQDASSTSQINVNEDTVIAVPVTNGTSTVTIPASTTITKTAGGTIDVSALIATDVAASSLSGLTAGTVALGAFKWGIVDLGLTFSSPITVSIFVGTDLNGQTLDVYRSTSGSGGWTQDGIADPKTCTVSSGLCTFQATQASYYVATGAGSSPSPSPTPSSGGRGGGGMVFQTTTVSSYKATTPDFVGDQNLGTSTTTSNGSGKTGAYQFTRMLKMNMTGKDVKQLQVFLNSHGFSVAKSGVGSSGKEGSLFGIKTKAALIKFQESHAKEILVPQGLKKGSGLFGSATMKFVNAMLVEGR